MSSQEVLFNEKQVAELVRYYCEMQRILCQFPVPHKDKNIKLDIDKIDFELICKKIKIDCDIEKIIPFKKSNFKSILEISKDK